MYIESITVRDFKALKDVTFSPGYVNVIIGANGSGKSTLLEAMGLLSAAMTDRVDGNSLTRKGVRLSAPSLYKSAFKAEQRSQTISLMFAVDNFDQAMHPRLAKAVMRNISNIILQQEKTVFFTTHNPLVLDGLDLSNDKIRLFALNRSAKNGHVSIDRIQVSEELIHQNLPLSQLWTSGRIGGSPDLL